MPGYRSTRAVTTLTRTVLERRNISNRERWGSLAGGTLSLALAFRRRGLLATVLGFLGGVLLFRGLSGYCPVSERLGRRTRQPDEPDLIGSGEIRLHQKLVIDAAPADVYHFLRDFEKLPEVFSHLRKVEAYDQNIHWVARGPLGIDFAWDAKVTEDHPSERLAWRSVGSHLLSQSGAARIREASAGQGSELDISLCYRPPGGAVGRALCRWLGGMSEPRLATDLEHLKHRLESNAPAAKPAPGPTRRPVPGAAVPDQGLGPEPITPAHG